MARRQKIFCGRKIIIDLKNLETCFIPPLAYPPKEKKKIMCETYLILLCMYTQSPKRCTGHLLINFTNKKDIKINLNAIK